MELVENGSLLISDMQKHPRGTSGNCQKIGRNMYILPEGFDFSNMLKFSHGNMLAEGFQLYACLVEIMKMMNDNENDKCPILF